MHQPKDCAKVCQSESFPWPPDEGRIRNKSGSTRKRQHPERACTHCVCVIGACGSTQKAGPPLHGLIAVCLARDPAEASRGICPRGTGPGPSKALWRCGMGYMAVPVCRALKDSEGSPPLLGKVALFVSFSGNSCALCGLQRTTHRASAVPATLHACSSRSSKRRIDECILQGERCRRLL